MRILHTADLHIGKVFEKVSMLEDQKYILKQISDIAIRENVDAVLIAGDVYQRSAPQAEAMEVFDGFVTALTDAGKKVFMLSGNHDSAQRISYFSSLIKGAGVYAAQEFDGHLQTVTLSDKYGSVNIHMLPFVKPVIVKHLLPEAEIDSCTDAVRAVLDASPINESERNILICHQFAAGAVPSDSEESSVGGLDIVDASVFDAFDYVAMGHIHKPQKMGRDTLRYAGSPLKYSFSEAAFEKSVVIADVGKKGSIKLKTVPLKPLRDVRILEGMLDELMALPYSEDLVWATVHDEDVMQDASLTLRTVFPNLCRFTVSNSKTKDDLTVLSKEEMEGKSITELFTDFYQQQNNNRLPSDKLIALLTRILDDMEVSAE